jgi:hypothetical protein
MNQRCVIILAASHKAGDAFLVEGGKIHRVTTTCLIEQS